MKPEISGREFHNAIGRLSLAGLLKYADEEKRSVIILPKFYSLVMKYFMARFEIDEDFPMFMKKAIVLAVIDAFDNQMENKGEVIGLSAIMATCWIDDIELKKERTLADELVLTALQS